MISNYLDELQTLLKRTRPRLHLAHQLEFKRCFGAVAGYVDGHIFISYGKFGVALRLPPETLTQLFREEDVAHLRYFPKGHIKREYAVIPQRIINDHGRFKRLLDKSVRYALPPSP